MFSSLESTEGPGMAEKPLRASSNRTTTRLEPENQFWKRISTSSRFFFTHNIEIWQVNVVAFSNRCRQTIFRHRTTTTLKTNKGLSASGDTLTGQDRTFFSTPHQSSKQQVPEIRAFQTLQWVSFRFVPPHLGRELLHLRVCKLLIVYGLLDRKGTFQTFDLLRGRVLPPSNVEPPRSIPDWLVWPV